MARLWCVGRGRMRLEHCGKEHGRIVSWSRKGAKEFEDTWGREIAEPTRTVLLMLQFVLFSKIAVPTRIVALILPAKAREESVFQAHPNNAREHGSPCVRCMPERQTCIYQIVKSFQYLHMYSIYTHTSPSPSLFFFFRCMRVAIWCLASAGFMS